MTAHEIAATLAPTVPQALIVTGFVVVMMVLIEYLNVLTHGWWQSGLIEKRWRQYAAASFLGAIPGCLGAYTVVSLYSHGAISFGALVGTMIATSGDEAFVMFAMFPGRALALTAGLLIAGWVVAALTDRFLSSWAPAGVGDHELELHTQDTCACFDRRTILSQLRDMSFPRALLIALFGLFFYALADGSLAGDEPVWIRTTMVGSALFASFVVVTVPDHFLEKHLWEHVLRKHLVRIFTWTLGALVVIGLLTLFVDVDAWIRGNLFTVLVVAALIGLIPESGPHLAFVTLYATGTLPLGILVASSIVQDGHGTLPLLAVSKAAFVRLKVINLVVGLAVGGLLLVLMP
ncbi:MAG: putative manganese transporter [Gemmatimonadota bacterium]